MAELDVLVALQALDTELDAKRTRLDDIKASLADNAEIKAARAALAAAESKLHEAETRQRQLEYDVDDRTSKIKELDGRLYSGKIGNPKELASLQTEIQHMRADLARVEEQALEAIGVTDGRRSEVENQTGGVADLQKRSEARHGDLHAEQSALEAAVSALRTERTRVASDVPGANMTKYEELRRQRRGLAVARVDRNTCLGCRTTLPTATVQSARQGKLAFCSSCGRILYVGR